MSDDFSKSQDFYLWKGPVKNNVQELKKLHKDEGVAITTIHDMNKGTLPQYNSNEQNRHTLNNWYHHVIGSIIMSNGLEGDDHAQLIVSNIKDVLLVEAMVLSINKDTKVNDSYAFSFGGNRDEQNAIFETVYKSLEGSGKAVRISGKDIDKLNNKWYANPNLRQGIHVSLNNQDENFFNEFVNYVETETGRKFSDEANGVMGVYLNRMNGWRPLVRGSVGDYLAGVVSDDDFLNYYGRLLGGSVGDAPKVQSAEGATARENKGLEGKISFVQGESFIVGDFKYSMHNGIYLASPIVNK